MKRPPITRDQLENFGSVITFQGSTDCLGSLMHFQGHGVFDPTHGLVPVTPEEADQHNAALDLAIVKGLEENCEVGMKGTAYLTHDAKGAWKVRTFTGLDMAETVRIIGRAITFTHKGMTFRGQRRKDCDLFTFRRTA